jgi:hypothetical protein
MGKSMDGIWGGRLGGAVAGEKQPELPACLTGEHAHAVERVASIPKHRHDDAEPHRS